MDVVEIDEDITKIAKEYFLSLLKFVEKPYVSKVCPIFILLFCHKFFAIKRPNLGHLQGQNKTKTKNSYI